MVLDSQNNFYKYSDVRSNLIIGRETAAKPLVSVIMPIYNHPDFFEKSLCSVLSQKCNFEYEIIIVDNNHPELQKRNQEIVEKFKCDKIHYYLNESNIGSAGNENRGIQIAKGDFVTFCHDDDMLFEDALQVLVNHSKKLKDDKIAIFGRIESIDKNDCIITKFTEWDTLFLRKKKKYRVRLYDFLFRNYTNGCGSLYSRACLMEVGGFCEDYNPVPDYALNANYVSMFGAYAIGYKTLKYRVSSQSDTGKVYKLLTDSNKKIRESLLDKCQLPWYIPKFYVKISLKMFQLNLYSRWDDNKPSYFQYFIYKIINRFFFNLICFNRSLR